MNDINRDAFEAAYLQVIEQPGLVDFVKTFRTESGYSFTNPQITLLMNSGWWAWQSGQLYMQAIQQETGVDHVLH